MRPIEKVEVAVRAAASKKATDVVVLEMHELLAITDLFVICSASSDRQVRTIAQEIGLQLKAVDVRPIRTEGERDGGWILLDYGDMVVHVFRDAEREFYDLERLWKDAPRIVVLAEATG